MTTKKLQKKEVSVVTYDSENQKQYCFPEYGISVEAKTIEEARKKLKKHLANKEK